MLRRTRGRRVIRTRGGAWTALAAAVLAIYLIHLALAASTLAGRVGFWLSAAAAATIAVRTFLAGIVVTATGIRMCAIVWSRSVPWEKVERFSAERQWIWHTPRSLVVELSDGRRWRSPAIFFQTEGEERAVLADLLDAQRTAARPAG